MILVFAVGIYRFNFTDGGDTPPTTNASGAMIFR